MAKATTKADGTRIYEVDGKKLPSVTTILGLLQKAALMPWAVKMTVGAVEDLINRHAYSHNMLEGLVTLSWDDHAGGLGLINILQEAKKAYRAKSKEAMDIGTAVHEAIQAWIESDGKMSLDEISDYQTRQGLQGFLNWGDEHDIHIISWEQVVSDGELFAGRYDLLAEVDGNITLVDFKTSTGIWDEYWTQVNAYASCLLLNNCPPSHVAVLRIDKVTGEIEYQSQPIDLARIEAFKHLAQYYNLTKGSK